MLNADYTLADDVERAEKLVLSELWLSPEEMYRCCCDAEITGPDFSQFRHSVQYAYLCSCVELGRRHHPNECLSLARSVAFVSSLELSDICGIIALDTNADLREWYADNLRGMADRMDKAKRLLCEYVSAVHDESYEITIHVRRRATDA